MKWRDLLSQEPVSVLKQTNWNCGFFDFGKALGPGIRYFNPAIIHFQGQDWLYARKAEECRNEVMGINRICAFRLDEKHKPLFYHVIKQENRNYKKQHFEDPRVTIIDGNIWLSYATFQVMEREKMWTGAHQGVAVLDDQRNVSGVWDPIYGTNGGSPLTGSGIEKNWLWFEHQKTPHMIYMTTPHEVVRWEGFKVAEVYIKKQEIPWHLGQPRGGTSPVLIGNEYWSFFHSSVPWKDPKRRYHMGAYCFDSKPPFGIKWMTSKPLLTGSVDDPWQEGLPLVIFPCGAIFRNDQWLVTSGVNDYVSCWHEIPHRDLVKLCVKVQ